MSLCVDCDHSVIIEYSRYRMCKKVTDKNKQTKNKADWTMCMNERINGACGPEGKLWEQKKAKKDK